MLSMKNKLYRVLLKYFLLLSIISAVFGLSVYAILTYNSMHDVFVNNLLHNRDKQVQLMEYWFEDRVNELNRISSNAVVEKGNFKEIDLLFKEHLSGETSNFSSFIFVDQDGMILVDGKKEDSGVCVGDRNYFQAVMEGNSYVSEVIMHKLTRNFSVVVASPVVSKDGKIIGAVVGTLNLDRVGDLLASFRQEKSEFTYLVDKNGLMIAEASFSPWLRENGMTVDSSKYGLRFIPEVMEKLKSGGNGYGEYINYRGVQALAAYQAFSHHGWGLIVEAEKAEMMEPYVERIFTTILFFALIFALIIYPLARFMARRLALPFEEIGESALQFTENCLKNNLKDSFESEPEGQKGATAFRAVESKPVYEEVETINKAFHILQERMSGIMATFRAQALYDQLTGLSNKRNFFLRGQEIIELARRKNNPCSLIYFDIDDFKKIKESNGHEEADQVLIHLANLMGKITRISDIACRLEGEEFAIILPETDETGAKFFAERFRECVEQTPVEINYHSFNIKVSIGVSVFSGLTDKNEKSSAILETLLSQADKAMEQAKKNGGNRAELFI